MRHDWHYVEELSRAPRSIGKILPAAELVPNPNQPRVEIGDLTELAASIKEKGVLEPILVKPQANGNVRSYLIIAGERRWRAAQLAGLIEVPCVELDIDEAEIAEIALVENLQRKDLTVWEEADGLQALIQRFGYTHEEIARRIGKSRSSVTELLTVAGLPAHIREMCRANSLNSKSSLLNIARQFDEPAMLDALRQISTARNGNQDDALILRQEELPQTSDGDFGNNDKQIQANVDQSGVTIAARSARSAAFPLKYFDYASPDKDFKLTVKAKKPLTREDLIKFLLKVINDFEDDRGNGFDI